MRNLQISDLTLAVNSANRDIDPNPNPKPNPNLNASQIAQRVLQIAQTYKFHAVLAAN